MVPTIKGFVGKPDMKKPVLIITAKETILLLPHAAMIKEHKRFSFPFSSSGRISQRLSPGLIHPIPGSLENWASLYIIPLAWLD